MNAEMPAAGKQKRLILLTGASGYIGGRLLRTLHERGERVRAIARRPDDLRGSVPADVEVVGGDVLDAASLAPVFEGVDTAYYLIHAMASHRDFESEERAGAENFARAAKAANIHGTVEAPRQQAGRRAHTSRERDRDARIQGLDNTWLGESFVRAGSIPCGSSARADSSTVGEPEDAADSDRRRDRVSRRRARC